MPCSSGGSPENANGSAAASTPSMTPAWPRVRFALTNGTPMPRCGPTDPSNAASAGPTYRPAPARYISWRAVIGPTASGVSRCVGTRQRSMRSTAGMPLLEMTRDVAGDCGEATQEDDADHRLPDPVPQELLDAAAAHAGDQDDAPDHDDQRQQSCQRGRQVRGEEQCSVVECCTHRERTPPLASKCERGAH